MSSIHEDGVGKLGSRKEREPQCNGVAKLLHDRENHEILCWVILDGGTERMEWIFYLAMVTLDF